MRNYSDCSMPALVVKAPRCKLQPYTCRMLIMLLYGAGLRISEALSLTLANVDLPATSSLSAKANSTRHGWCPSARISPGP